MAKILSIEDEPDISGVVEHILLERGHTVRLAESGAGALNHLTTFTPDLILLDLNLPDVTGLDLFHSLRRELPDIPIIMVTAREKATDRVKGLEMGADDYITKPFNNDELVARVSAVLRRSGAKQMRWNGTSFGPLKVDAEGCTVHYCNQAVSVTLQEVKFLDALIRNPARNFTRDYLIDAIYGPGHAVTERSVDSMVTRLRKKLCAIRPTPNPIQTLYGIGYKLNAELDQPGP